MNEQKIKLLLSAEINVWDGDIIGIKKRQEGFTGHEARDTEIVMDRALRFEKTKNEFLGTTRKR